MSSDPDGPLIRKIKDIKRISNQSSGMHGAEEDRHSMSGHVLTAVALLSSAFLLMLSLASEDLILSTLGLNHNVYKWALALLSFATLSVTLVSLTWRPAEKAGRHRAACIHFTRTKHRADALLRHPDVVSEEMVNDLADSYLSTESLPTISNRRFVSLKRRHLIKVALRVAVSENPHVRIRRLQKNLARSNKLVSREDARMSESLGELGQ